MKQQNFQWVDIKVAFLKYLKKTVNVPPPSKGRSVRIWILPLYIHLLKKGCKSPTSTKESDTMSKDLKKRGMNFIGTTICWHGKRP